VGRKSCGCLGRELFISVYVRDVKWELDRT
jgi:hypothetical protein